MRSEQDSIERSVKLRRRAEELLMEKAALSSKIIDTMSHEEALQNLHELQVHQVELEMQNEELLRVQTEIEMSRARYFDLYDLAPVGYCTLSEKGLILEANLTAAGLLGVDRGALVKQPIFRFIFKEDQDIYYLYNKQLLATSQPQAWELRMVKRDGTPPFWVHMAVSATQAADGTPASRIVLSDITERKMLEMALAQERKLLEATLVSIGDGVISTDNKGNIVFLNRVAEFLTGWTQEEASGKPIEEVFNIVDEFTREKSEVIAMKILQKGEILQSRKNNILIAKDGTERPVKDSAAPIVQENGEIVGVVLGFTDYSEQKQKQEKIEFLSYHDQLTGLYNRRFYGEELRRIDTERNLPISIAMADVNGLKLINDSFGHVMGDELLRKVADAIKKGCRADDIIARLGGDEFVVIFPKMDSSGVEKIIRRIQDILLKERVAFLDVSVSFGYETKESKGENIQETFRNAENRMYRQKLSASASVRSKTLALVMNTFYEKSNREMQHSKRVSAMCEDIASKMNFNAADVNQLKIAGLMHDIGKIGVDEKIIDSAQQLNDAEVEEIKRHAEIGYRILSSVNDFSEIADIILEHHEKWDGTGYPKGLKGEDISIQARIIALADAFDAMTNPSPYGVVLSVEQAVLEIQRCSGTQFDPDIAKVFVENILTKEV